MRDRQEMSEELIDEKTAKDSIAIIIGQISEAKSQKSNLKINENDRIKALQRWDFWNFERIKNYFYIAIFVIFGWISFGFIEGFNIIWEKDFVIWTLFLNLYCMSIVWEEHNEKGYIKRLISTKGMSTDDLSTYTYYIFKKVPFLKIKSLIVFFVGLCCFFGYFYFFENELIDYVIHLFFIINLLFIAFFEFIFIKYED